MSKKKKISKKEMMIGNVFIGIGILMYVFYIFLALLMYSVPGGLFFHLIGLVSIIEGWRRKNGKGSVLFPKMDY